MLPTGPAGASATGCALLPYAGTDVCERCGGELTGRRRRWCSTNCSYQHAMNHRWSMARKAAVRRDRRRCVTCGSTVKLEVNHIVPRNGGGYGWGCHHHLGNLETLCHSCHVVVTNAQQRARREAGVAGGT